VAEPAVSPAAPREAPRWRVHDRTHLELNLQYPLRVKKGGERFEWEAYFFVPKSFRLDELTYDKDDIYADFTSYVRLAVAPARFDQLTAGPLARLERALAVPDAARATRELRLFACRVRRAGIELERGLLAHITAWSLAEAGARASGAPSSLPTPSTLEAAVTAALDTSRELTLRLRSTLEEQLGSRPAHEELTVAGAWVDEDVSQIIETIFGRVGEALAGFDELAPLRERLVARAVSEARYRAARGYEASVGGDRDARAVEKLEFRRHTLKRFTSSVLWLTAEVHPAGRWARHVLFGLAACVAMTFAVGAAFWHGAMPVRDQASFWVVVVALAYAVKDRLKAGLQEAFTGVLSRRVPDRRWRVRDGERGRVVGQIDEHSGFATFDGVPRDVLETRRLTRKHPIEEQARPETVLWHRKRVTVDADQVKRGDESFDGLMEIFRVDLRRWLTNTDDPKNRVVFADPSLARIDTVVAPRVYNIAIVYRLRRRNENPPWHRARVVVSRKGVRRIDPIC
jgi:hypothetical protein